MELNFYLLIILFAAFSAFNIGMIHLIQQLKKRESLFLAVGTILFAVCLAFYFYEVSGLFKRYPALLWINAPILFLIGPAFYLHLKKNKHWLDLLHLLPALYFLHILRPFYLLSSRQKLAFYNQMFEAGNYQPDYSQYLYLLSIGIYCLLAFLKLQKQQKQFQELASNPTKLYSINTISTFYLLLGIAGLVSFISSLLLDYTFNYFVEFDFIVLFLLALIILALQWYIIYQGLNIEQLDMIVPKQSNSLANAPKYQSLIQDLGNLMRTQYLYRQQNLKITDLANMLGVSMHELSAAINQHYQINFFTYINKLRVEELKSSLLAEENKHLTLWAIAKNAGFSSNSSFYRVFKKQVGCTPKQYIDQHQALNYANNSSR